MAKMNLLPVNFPSGRIARFFTSCLLVLAGILPTALESPSAPYLEGLALTNETKINAQATPQNVCSTISVLIQTIQALHLNAGVEQALTVKLDNALASFTGGNHTAAINQLNAFINQVEAKRGNPLTNETADELIAGAITLITAIENGTADCGGPELECSATLPDYCDYTTNNPNLWNQPYWWNATTGLHNLCEGDAPLTITSTNSCSGSNVNISYLLFLDTDGDGNTETVINSNNPPAPGTVNYDNAGNPNYNGGTPRVFDGRPVSSNNIYRWASHQSVSGTSRTASVQWKTFEQMPTTVNQFGTPGIAPQLPYGTHTIKWTITDTCGNQAACEYAFVVRDCKLPLVVCTNGLIANIGANGTFWIGALDFLIYAEDNCTPVNLLKYGIRKKNEGTGFPLDELGNPITSLTFDCTELGYQLVTLWVMDLVGNADYCETYILIQDNGHACDQYRSDPGAGIAEPLKLDLFPNPANSAINIRLQGVKSTGVLTLFNPLGSAVWQQPVGSEVSEIKIPLANNCFAPGVYLVRLRVEQEVIIRRLVVYR